MSYAAGAALKELRVVLCSAGSNSHGVRSFWHKNYAIVKKDNQKIPILLREAKGAAAKLTAAYDYGKETSVSVEGFSEAEFDAALKSILKGP